MKKSKIKLFTAIILCLLMAGCKIAANNGDKNPSDPTNVTTPSDTDDSEDSEDPVTPEDPDTPENPETPEDPDTPEDNLENQKVYIGTWVNTLETSKIYLAEDGSFKCGLYNKNGGLFTCIYLKGTYSIEENILTLNSEEISFDAEDWLPFTEATESFLGSKDNYKFIFGFAMAEGKMILSTSEGSDEYSKVCDDEGDITFDVMPDDPETPEETVSLCGVNWEVINDQINGAYYFDENGTYYGYSTILAANKTTYARGTYEILPDNKMNMTIEESCFAKEPVSVFEILINEDFEMPEGNFQWMPYTQEDPTIEIDYSLNNDKLTLSMGEMIYELSLASVQPTDLSGKKLCLTQSPDLGYIFKDDGIYELVTRFSAEAENSIVYGKYVYNELFHTLLIKPESIKLSNGTTMLVDEYPDGEAYFKDTYLDYFDDENCKMVITSYNGTMSAYVYVLVDQAESYFFSNKYYSTANNDRFYSTGNLISLYLSEPDFSDAYILEKIGNTIKLRYIYGFPVEYDGFYFDCKENPDSSITLTSKIGPGQTLKELKDSYGVVSFVCKKFKGNNQLRIVPFINDDVCHDDTNNYYIYCYISDGKISIPLYDFEETYTEHFDEDVPYFEAGGYKFEYLPLEFTFVEDAQ